MARKKTHAPLDVLINGRLVGRLEKAASGATSFRYSEEWLSWEHRFAISLSLPLTPAAYRGPRSRPSSTIFSPTETQYAAV